MAFTALMIAPDEEFDGAPNLRRAFSLETSHGRVNRASLSYTARGVIEATINGHRVSADLLTPGWSSYEWRLRYATADVTDLVETDSVVGLRLGRGWYSGRLGWTGASAVYGREISGLAELTIEYEDGHVQTVVTDASWKSGPSGTTANDLYDGQVIDARGVQSGWDLPGFDDRAWSGVHECAFDSRVLTAYVGPSVRRQEELRPTEIWRSPSDKLLVDFGQNLVGWVRVRTRGTSGDELVIRHAEVLEDGELGTRPLRSALATDRYILSGEDDVFEPTFTFHGFRYIELSGWRGEIQPEQLVAVVIGSDLTRTGTFSCSDPLLTQFHRNVVWGMRGNFVDVPTDCPQRDERLGWTGDIAAFAPTAAFLFDVGPFLNDWMCDVDQEQAHADGIVPFVVPDVLKYLPNPGGLPDPESAAFWSDAAAWVPWALWIAYGDRDALADQFPAMAAHARRVRSLLSPSGLWDTGFQFGDWLDPDAPPEDPFRAKADNGVVATACAFRTATIVADAAAVLGLPVEVEFRVLASRLRAAFNEHYVIDGIVRSDCATVYALAIAFDLLAEPDRAVAGVRLAELASANRFRISTGFIGTPFIADALTATGHLGEAYELLLSRECPSWLYPVTMGATTVWERWDAMLPDGSINPGQMTSFNHYALGAVADWMHRTIGGIAPLEPGYRTILVQPQPGGGLTHASTSLITSRGRVAVSWQQLDGELIVDVEIPRGATGVVRLPARPEQRVTSGSHRFRVAAGALR